MDLGCIGQRSTRSTHQAIPTRCQRDKCCWIGGDLLGQLVALGRLAQAIERPEEEIPLRLASERATTRRKIELPSHMFSAP